MILVFVILGNAASGGPFARPLLPGLWRTIGGVLPPGASVDLARSALFFDGARIAGPILVLVGWAAFGTALVIALGGRIVDPVEAEGGRGRSGGVTAGAYGRWRPRLKPTFVALTVREQCLPCRAAQTLSVRRTRRSKRRSKLLPFRAVKIRTFPRNV